ncbi:hypothetical protein ATZ99_06060 [Thermovenabulum gondwanense]|uniref:Uncharacterized protein n=1 Tax=Thermovenabulum gondwanense TaxID=520767 RepID=A0A161PYP7_9FIRM|nr:hypothetical protein ATZ99_06060 [Thermovenabulum gondwanense]
MPAFLNIKKIWRIFWKNVEIRYKRELKNNSQLKF